MIRFNPFISTLTKNNNNIVNIIKVLQQYDYGKAKLRTPIIYRTKYNELENFFAIENEIPDLLVKSNNLLKFGVPKSHYQAIDIKYYLRNYDPKLVLKGNKHERFENRDFIYKNQLLTRLWFERKPERTEVRILMDKCSFHYSYWMTINNEHTFEEVKNNIWQSV